MFWRPDPNIDAARQLPEWKQFHRLCGQHGLAFDAIERSGRKYQCRAVQPKRTDMGGWMFFDRGLATGKTVVEAIQAAFLQSGIEVPGGAEMLERGLCGARVSAPQPDDDFADLLGDDFEELLG
ncbi:hypothetical protein BES08_07110 [Novosphingobium resinovorum]|uniref:Uncharacterized protein n=2 Tax=Novosphingobium resinovorum TaxID=158500 RepID=A0A1D8A340_9SPHN|nr:hypothetical protein BES08_07110 [Novosphingobium resinovorum]